MTMTIRSDEDIRNVERFIATTAAMRRAQKNYFRFRDGVTKAHAMKLEQEVDQQIAVWEMDQALKEARVRHPELFPGTEHGNGGF
jgi:hypothetical protein